MSSFCCDPSRYLPHRTPMLLIDRVLAADAETTRCRVTVGEQCSLFRQADGSYPNSLFIEFMAQTVGVFAGIRDSESGIGPRVGFLLGSRKVQLHKKTLAEGDVFDIDTRCLFFGQEELPSQFECRVLENNTEVASAVLTVYRPHGLPSSRPSRICSNKLFITMTSSTNLTVLVTGASRGIGRAIALQLARDGFCVVVHGSKPSAALDETLELITQAGGKARPLTFDVCDREAAQQALLADVEANGAYYGIVVNAGIARDGTFAAMPSEDWDSVIHTDLTGFYNVVQPMVMPMVRRRKPGRIVVISSVSGVVGNRGQVNYSAAKAGLIGAAKALAMELASRSITVNAVAPGLIETEMVTEEVLEHAMQLIPMRRIGKPEEVAGVVSFLMSEAASYVTRQVIGVNGGLA